MATVNVTIVGLERLGASFGLALQALNKRADARHQFIVTGCDKSMARLRAAGKAGAVEAEIPEFDLATERADLVILATPYSDAKAALDLIGGSLKPGAVIIDLSPLKLPSIAWGGKAFKRDSDGTPLAYLVGVTPVVNPAWLGELETGVEGARADFFDGGTFIISPGPGCPPEAVQLVADLADLLKVRSHFVDPLEHDGMVAGMDGLPALMQFALFHSLNTSKSWSDAQWVGNPAFFLATYHLLENDTASPAAMLAQNGDHVVRRIDALIESLQGFREIIRTGDAEGLADSFERLAEQYALWRESRLKNQWESDRIGQADTSTAGLRMGVMGALLPNFGGKKDKDKDGKKGRK